MRAVILLMLVILASSHVHAKNDVIPFAGVQSECMQVDDITFGSSGRWASCNVTRGRWFATIDFLDMYQAQYCLGKEKGVCDRRAMVLFANRAYTPDAKVLLAKVDDGAVKYDDPRVVAFSDETIMGLSMLSAAGAVAKSFYLWRTDHWMLMEEAQAWVRDLSGLLPEGTSTRQFPVWPDLETMTAQVRLFHPEDADCCPSGDLANVELGLVNGRFTLMQVKVDAVEK